MRRGSGWAQLLGAVCAVGGLAASACGSRSGLDELIVVLPGDGGTRANDAGPDVAADAPEPLPDGTTDGPPLDAPVDAPVDAPPDVHRPHDAGPDVVIPPNCSSPSIQYIYMFTEANHIWSLFPQTGSLALVGTINCTSNGTPFSMAVDRNGSAYVLYRNGAADGTSAMFHVSLRTLKCTPTAWVSPGSPFDTFGMGFVGDSNGLTDTLYIAGATSPATLGKLDLGTFTVTTVGSLGVGVDSPELSGTLDGRLFAFHDNTAMTTSQVDQIDPSSLSSLATYPFSNLPQGNGWAFGFWGGDFYLFTAPGNLLGWSPVPHHAVPPERRFADERGHPHRDDRRRRRLDVRTSNVSKRVVHMAPCDGGRQR